MIYAWKITDIVAVKDYFIRKPVHILPYFAVLYHDNNHIHIIHKFI